MSGARLTRSTSGGVALLSDERRPGGVTFAFTERTGGVSEGAYASLNLGDRCGDDAACVQENRRRVLAALGAEAYADRLVNPMQVHGANVVTIADGSAEGVRAAQEQARQGADAVVCVVPRVPVLLCYADCVPVVLTAPGAFAVVHSGWRGTEARIGQQALQALCRVAGVAPAQVNAYVGPHVGGTDYQVSQELLDRFAAAFGPEVCLPSSCLDLGRCVRMTLEQAGIPQDQIAVCEDSTASTTDRFFSYRASGGMCGRHGAVAFLPDSDIREV